MKFRALEVLVILEFSGSPTRGAGHGFTEASVRALRLAGVLAQPGRGRVTLLSAGVFMSGLAALFGPKERAELASMKAGYLKQCEGWLLAQARAELPEGTQVELQVGTRGAAVELLEAQRRGAHDLAVMSGCVKAGLAQRALNPATERVLRDTALPVIMPGSGAPGLELIQAPRVLAAVDLSDSSLRALRVALALARDLDGSLTAVAVNTLPSFIEPGLQSLPGFSKRAADWSKHREEALAERVEESLASARRIGVPCALEIRRGAAAAEILKASASHDLAVLGISGESEARPGSVLRRVIRESQVPVLACP